ncbi:MAG: hypothetical protein RBR77_07085, partial [Thauera sp.]|nr:hypothetical protein [Thauera sp.]
FLLSGDKLKTVTNRRIYQKYITRRRALVPPGVLPQRAPIHQPPPTPHDNHDNHDEPTSNNSQPCNRLAGSPAVQWFPDSPGPS